MFKAILSILVAVCIFNSIYAAGGIENTALESKLENIVIDKIELKDATIYNVVRFLRKRAKELDKDGKGINIMLKLSKKEAQKYKVTLSLDKVPLGEVIRYVCMSAGLKYNVHKNIVIIGTSETMSQKMETRSYKTHPNTVRKAK